MAGWPFDKRALLAWREGVKARLGLGVFGARNPQIRALTLPASMPREGRRDGLAIVAIVKDEAAYLEEWILFHVMLGARSVILYDNGSTDGTADLVAQGHWGAEVTRLDWRSFDGIDAAQQLAYNHALANHGADHRWMAFIDVDEFLMPLEGDDLPAALDRFSHQPGVTLPWVNFGPDGHSEKPPGLVIESYTERAAFPPRSDQYALLRYKTVVDPVEVAVGGSHTFMYRREGNVMINEAGERAAPWEGRLEGFARSDVLRLNHYFTRSEAELAAKLAKGRVSRNGGMNLSAYDRRMAQYRLATERDETALRFVEPLKARIAARRRALGQRDAG